MISVILGVSLAFLVGNYAQEESYKAEAEFVISSLLEEVESDIDSYDDYQIPDNEEKAAQLKRALGFMDEGKEMDSVVYLLANGALHINNYYPSNITLNSILSSGKLDIVRDFGLRKDLMIYRANSEEVKFQGQAQVDFFTNQLIPWYLENPEFFESEGSESTNAEAYTLFNLYYSFLWNKTEKYKSILKDAQNLQKNLINYQISEGFEIEIHSQDSTSLNSEIGR